jgi:hypothetical protein
MFTRNYFLKTVTINKHVKLSVLRFDGARLSLDVPNNYN